MSCKFCILGSQADLLGTTLHEESHDLYREQVQLEIDSSFSFQDNKWLGDIAPHLLTPAMCAGLYEAKQRAVVREQAEAQIPPHLLYTKGWPTCMPTQQEARLLASVRRAVSTTVHFPVQYTDADSVYGRYADLMAAKPVDIQALLFRQELMTLES